MFSELSLLGVSRQESMKMWGGVGQWHLLRKIPLFALWYAIPLDGQHNSTARKAGDDGDPWSKKRATHAVISIPEREVESVIQRRENRCDLESSLTFHSARIYRDFLQGPWNVLKWMLLWSRKGLAKAYVELKRLRWEI